MRHFTIKRSEWFRGQGSLSSRLVLPPEGTGSECRCCLGFYGLACGLTDDQMRGKETPARLYSKDNPQYDNWFALLMDEIGSITPNCLSMMHANDIQDLEYTDTAREADLTDLFEQIDVKVTFED